MKIFSVLILSCLPFFATAQSSENAPVRVPKGSTPPTVKGQEAYQAQQNLLATLPMLPKTTVKRLWDSCTRIEYTFLQTPFTMALADSTSIRESLRHIGYGEAVRKTDCKIFAKVFFYINGDLILDADMFFTEGCRFFVYNIDGKPAYANLMSSEGRDFLMQILEGKAHEKSEK